MPDPLIPTRAGWARVASPTISTHAAAEAAADPVIPTAEAWARVAAVVKIVETRLTALTDNRRDPLLPRYT